MRPTSTLRYILLALFLSNCCLNPARSMVTPGDDLFDSARIYNNMGIDMIRSGDLEQAAELFKRSLEIKRREHGSLSSDMATTYSNLGVVNRRLYNNRDAMLYYDTAGLIINNHHGPDHSLLGAIYQNQGNILREQRDVSSALTYYNNALRIFSHYRDNEWVARLYNNIGLTYRAMMDTEKAEDYFLRSINIRKNSDPAGIAIPAANLANFYMQTGNIAMADRYYKLAMEVLENYWSRNNDYFGMNLMNYGVFLITDGGEPERGYNTLLDALEIHRNQYGEEGQHVARTYMNIGYYFELAGNYPEALEYQQKSLIANSKSFRTTDISGNPPPDEEVYSLDYLLASLNHKARSLHLLSGPTGVRSGLEASLATYRLAMKYIERIRMGHTTEDSQILLSESEHETYMEAINVAWRLYELTGDKSYIEEAFAFSERSKAASLLASIRDVEARSFGGIPGELLEQEDRLKRNIAAFRELVYEEQRTIDADTARINFWQGRVFSLELELRQLISRLEVEYPGYYDLKYNQQVSTVSDIMQGIGSRDALISYVHNDSLVHVFTITSRRSKMYSIKTTGNMVHQIGALLEVLTNGNLDRRVREDMLTFSSSSRYLYKLLLEPVISELSGKRLIIVPDGILSYVPFELLLSADPAPGRTSYKDMKYLFLDYPVSYNYSATLWQESRSGKRGGASGILAMAPKYEFAELPAADIINSRQYYRDRLTPLPGAREEAIRIAQMMDGKVMLDESATERNFKNTAHEFQVLHLAMHTLLDDDNPMFSKLVFSEPEDEMEDGFLNTYEIYNLRLNACLAVLSSCRSGYGTMRRGEGVMSLARGFMYSGVPAIVMTNWEIEDKSGAEIMISFYKYLLKGYRKDEALRQARIDFLENTDLLKAHPYFWGAYMCIGNPDEIFRTHRKLYPLATFGFLTIIMIAVIWRSPRRTRDKKRQG
jgi:CHAT domain-containing protein/Tfp pilus assembly protein PilF